MHKENTNEMQSNDNTEKLTNNVISTNDLLISTDHIAKKYRKQMSGILETCKENPENYKIHKDAINKAIDSYDNYFNYLINLTFLTALCVMLPVFVVFVFLSCNFKLVLDINIPILVSLFVIDIVFATVIIIFRKNYIEQEEFLDTLHDIHKGNLFIDSSSLKFFKDPECAKENTNNETESINRVNKLLDDSFEDNQKFSLNSLNSIT